MTKLTLLSAMAAAFCLIAGTASAQTTSADGAAGAFSKDTQSSSSSMPASAGATSAPSGAAAVAHQVQHRARSQATSSGAAVSAGPSGSANTMSGPK